MPRDSYNCVTNPFAVAEPIAVLLNVSLYGADTPLRDVGDQPKRDHAYAINCERSNIDIEAGV